MVNEKVSDGLKQPLFDLLSSRYDLLPLQSELDDIIEVCVGIHRERAAVKIEASNGTVSIDVKSLVDGISIECNGDTGEVKQKILDKMRTTLDRASFF